ncbi:hypothetical protein BOTBODRAFT_31395 [Botryobasidium botryosum FD-172 SS1]|uniref:Mediator of RNA polymerase II transcription subunit 19 n=1 Tax=Botryobasidium botryosum (strain FD-172 SS1) TaxID=930990 RepID=A0A067MWN0_BOTB1|nr:hypothetical protein BOTBODRAFT_31395 [Botryobasidium botryosum FD-172 SS1]
MADSHITPAISYATPSSTSFQGNGTPSRAPHSHEPSPLHAGPSSLPFFPPPMPRSQHTARLVNSTQDLLGRLHITPSYNSLVRPYLPHIRSTGQGKADGATVSGVEEKGKGKETQPMDGVIENGANSVSALGAGHTGGEAMDDSTGERKKKKFEHGYKSFISDLPGKHSAKKDTYLVNLVQQPPKQRMDITSFDSRTLEGFQLAPGVLQGFNQAIWLSDDKEKKKKKKKSRRHPDGSAAGATPAPDQSNPPGPPPIPPGPSSSASTPLPVSHLNGRGPATISTNGMHQHLGGASEYGFGGSGRVRKAPDEGGSPWSGQGMSPGPGGITARPPKKRRVDTPSHLPIQQPTPSH